MSAPDAEWQAEVIRWLEMINHRLKAIEDTLQALQQLTERVAGKPLP